MVDQQAGSQANESLDRQKGDLPSTCNDRHPTNDQIPLPPSRRMLNIEVFFNIWHRDNSLPGNEDTETNLQDALIRISTNPIDPLCRPKMHHSSPKPIQPLHGGIRARYFTFQ
ncbi:hypothetical protein ACFHW1_00755 [Micromonospora sp. LOL_014]|uniref:hypothetical protein n=1 Tax=Micromonospora sp. LOL_014 TaxID=3345415 RepID=UPI003A871D64